MSEAARQPMRDETGWMLSFNGEIYNHKQLREDSRGARYSSSGDTETLLRLLATYGPDAVIRLNGQFALAVLDPTEGKLLLTRDRFGIKPLYFAETDEEVWFASELGALVAAGIHMRWRTNGWQSVLEGSCYNGDRTLAKGVRRVPAGEWIAIDLLTGRLTRQRWVRIADAVCKSPQIARRRRRVRQLETVLRSAVHGAMMSDVPVGTLCSGGVDSSLITALAAEVAPGLTAFGARHRGEPALDEGPAARRAADAIGVELDLLDVTPSGWRSGFVESTVHFGAPLANASSVVVAQLAARARDRGIKVLLTGEGADELFAGYGALHGKVLADFQPRWVRALRALEPVLAPSPGERGLGPHWLRALAARRLTEPAWASLTDLSTPRDRSEAVEAYRHHPGPRGKVEAALLGRMNYTLCHLLNRMDKNMMQHSVEARVPFLDPAVLDLVLNLPLETRVGPWTKGILRDVARRLLPWRIAHRPKIYGMGFDAGTWIEQAANKRFLSDGVLREVSGLSRRELHEKLANAEKAIRIRIWSTEIWCRSILTRQSISAIEEDLWRGKP